jgi:hypothetical protein
LAVYFALYRRLIFQGNHGIKWDPSFVLADPFT